ncbi:MAG: RecQ family ATP-dependent DNA helicase [Melioribacteraceae bacterium]|nr:RecQ family ATP-dependent DNA helicase [Melioribacteraceae bacterium]
MQKILQNIFGFKEFRPGQEEIIQSIINGNNVLAVLPTGGGKSLCYQIPALLGETFSIVISPLIALMKDQVDSLNKNEILSAYINSTMDFREVEQVFRDLENRKLKLLYISPERLENIQFAERIKLLDPKYIFVDEAHCISEWGHSFRPSYRRIIEFADSIGNSNISAFTATAIPEVRRDIVEHFNFNNPRIFIKGFERDNLRLNVLRTSRKKEKVLELVSNNRLPAVIYTSTRKAAEELSEFLNFNKLKSAYYHAGIKPEQRRMIQDDFMNDRVKIICATNAFGMGVDKSDIRLLIHYNIPASLENYYQEIGRAGRDGKTAKVFLFYEDRDYHIQDYFINNSYPTIDEIKTVYNSICNSAKIAVGSSYDRRILLDNNVINILSTNKINQTKMNAALSVLDENNLLDFSANNISYSFIKILFDKDDLRTFIDKFAQGLNKDLLIQLLRDFSNSIFVQKKRIDISILSQKLSVNQKDIVESLKRLSIPGVIEYSVPLDKPSVRLVGERIAPTNLVIDVEHFYDLKENAKLKLDLMRNFAFTDNCRFKLILNYFGEELPEYSCGKCDNCKDETYKTRPQIEYLEEIVIDTIHQAGGRLRQNDLIKILLGIVKHSILQNNPNYGVCKHFKKDDLLDTIDILINKDLAKKFDSQLAITERGKDIFAIPENNNKEINSNIDNYNSQLEIFNLLKEVRKRIAKKFSQSEQIICNDNILREVAKELPSSPSKLLSLNGFTQWMFNKIGEDILEVILEHKLKNKDRYEKTKVKNELPESIQNTFVLLQKKYSLESIATLSKLPEAIISMQIETILEYLPKTEITSLLKKHEIELIRKEILEGKTEIKEIKENLPSFISYGKIRIVLAKNK